MLWSLIVRKIKAIMLKVWKLKSRNRSSRPEIEKDVSKKDVLRNLAKFSGKHLYQSLFLNKVAFLIKRLWHGRLLTEHLQWLLLT